MALVNCSSCTRLWLLCANLAAQPCTSARILYVVSAGLCKHNDRQHTWEQTTWQQRTEGKTRTYLVEWRLLKGRRSGGKEKVRTDPLGAPTSPSQPLTPPYMSPTQYLVACLGCYHHVCAHASNSGLLEPFKADLLLRKGISFSRKSSRSRKSKKGDKGKQEKMKSSRKQTKQHIVVIYIYMSVEKLGKLK